jgi:hypothetical protein
MTFEILFSSGRHPVYPALPTASDVVSPGGMFALGSAGLGGVPAQPEMPIKNAADNTRLHQETFIFDPVFEPK